MTTPSSVASLFLGLLLLLLLLPAQHATIIPVDSSPIPGELPGPVNYIVLVSYGTPEQQLPVLFDTSIGACLLRCKPRPSGSDGYNPSFDTSQSSTFAPVRCGSPDCPANCSDGSVCPFDNPQWLVEGTFAQDVLTLAPSLSVDDFRFVCQRPEDLHLPVAGTLDLSRDRNSLPSQLSSSWLAGPATFSYCLPLSPSSQGFLSFGSDYNLTAHAPLVSSSDPELSSRYFIDLVGISLDGEDLPIPAGTFGGNASTELNVGTTFTVLAPDTYAPLRDAFRTKMSQYSNRSAPTYGNFDTCFNFTGLDELFMPLVRFKFGNGERLLIHGDQMLYYDDPTAAPFTVACLAFSAFNIGADGESFSIIGSHTLANTEVVYDVAGGKVGFIPGSC